MSPLRRGRAFLENSFGSPSLGVPTQPPRPIYEETSLDR
jgi:hypothetical protein